MNEAAIHRRKAHERMEQDPEELLHNWPMIPAVGPEGVIGMVDKWRLESAVEQGIRHIRAQVQVLGIPASFIDPASHTEYRFLTETMLPHCRTPQQIANMVNGYMGLCMRQVGDAERQSEGRQRPFMQMLSEDRGRVTHIDGSFYSDQKHATMRERLGAAKVKTLTEYARNPMLDSVTQGLAKYPIYRYSSECFYDSALALMADPDRVESEWLEGHEQSTTVRNTPEHKRMTKEKLARLLQLPDLEGFVISDGMVQSPVLGSSMAIIAEYFCENDSAVFINKIDHRLIGKWLREKFERHKPPLEVAYYMWARCQQTEFEQEAAFIEQYILDHVLAHEPWFAEFVGAENTDESKPGRLFEIFLAAQLQLRENSDDPRYQKLLQIMPGREIAGTFTKSDTDAYRTASLKFLTGIQVAIKDVIPEYSPERFNQNPNQMLIDLFNDDYDEMVSEWTVYEGFELLDPFAIDAFKKSFRGWGVGKMREYAINALDEMDITGLLIFRNQVIPALKNTQIRAMLDKKLGDCIAKAYVGRLQEVAGTSTLVDIAKGRDVDATVIIPGLEALPPELRRTPTGGIMCADAEVALLQKVFKGARGEREIVNYLLAHNRTMRPVELIAPFADAPNLEIIKLYKESANLLLFLSISTILMYLGYSREEILGLIEDLVNRTEKESRSELSTVGVEWEQVGSVNNRVIANDRFAELFNVLPAGNDLYCNEILTLPSTSAEAQRLLLNILTNPQHGYLDTDALFEAERDRGHVLSSLHVNVGLDAGIGIGSFQLDAFMDPLITATWAAHGGHTQAHTARGLTRGWKHNALLDVFGNKDTGTKLEIRNLALEEDGSHTSEIDDILMIASACMQHARITRGIAVSSSGKVMGEIFDAFTKEVARLRFAPDEAASAREIIRRFASAVRTELKL